MGLITDNGSDIEYRMKIFLVGIYPPPYGGVSIHSQRLLEYLIAQKKDVFLIDVSKLPSNVNNVQTMNEMRMFWYLMFRERIYGSFSYFFKKTGSIILFIIL